MHVRVHFVNLFAAHKRGRLQLDRPLRFSPSERMERGLFALSVYFYDLAKMKDRNPKA